MNQSPFPLIRISGGPYERGVSYGEQASALIATSLAFYENAVLRPTGRSMPRVCDEIRRHAPAWRRQEPSLLREVDGTAAGSGFHPLEILALNSRGAFAGTGGSQAVAGATELAALDGCTSFAVLPESSFDGHMRTGQNWDYLEGIAPTIVLLHVRPDTGPSQLIIVEAGQLGRQGANDIGISLQANGLPGDRMHSALPAPLARRRILQANGWSEAIDAAFRVPRSDNTNLIVSHRAGFSIDLETEPEALSSISPANGFLSHTNHFLAGPASPSAVVRDPRPDSLHRNERASELLTLAVNRGGISASGLAAMCRDHDGDESAICRHADLTQEPGEQWGTVASVITDLTAGVMAVAGGPPCKHEYVPVDIATGEVITEPGARTEGTYEAGE